MIISSTTTRSLITSKLIYHPRNMTKKEFDNIAKKYKNYKYVNFKSTDNIMLSGMLINKNREPSYDDVIFLYNHGNAGVLSDFFESNDITFLSKFGSVFVYDYRNYGLSDNSTLNDDGTFMDVMGAWNYLTIEKNVNPNKIIIFGHSLGGAVSTELIKMLINENKPLPLCLILNNTFTNITDMAKKIFGYVGYYSLSKYDNIKNLNYISKNHNNFKILIIHSIHDEIIPYEHSLVLQKNCNCEHIQVTGGHSYSAFNKKIEIYIQNLIN
jgi:dipeptidyl aminopeptidase/acylaminoacyl peptidase